MPAEQAVVPVSDRGFLYGDSIFETVRAYGGKAFAGADHYQRLAESAKSVGIALPFGKSAFLTILDELLAANDLLDAMVRVTVSRGSGPAPVPDPSGCHSPTVVAMARPAPRLDEATWSRGIGAVVVPVQSTPKAVLNPTVKSGNFLSHILAIVHAKAHDTGEGAVEAILLDSKGRVAEGAVSNVFGVWNGTLNTPAADGDILPGITRKLVLDLARSLSIPVREGAISGLDLGDADELFVTNSGWEVMPVTRLNGVVLADGRVGPITRRLHEAYQKKVMASC
jgi:branched-chain amino acid aminotransferase